MSCIKQQFTPTHPVVSKQNDNVTLTSPVPRPLPQKSTHRNEEAATIAPSIMLAAVTSWLGSRRIRYCFLLLCSPLLCATFPLLCAAELCLRVCRRARQKSRQDDGLRRCEEGCSCGVEENEEEEEQEVGLLQRYLEDQMLLVGSMYECGDDDDGGGDSRTPLLV